MHAKRIDIVKGILTFQMIFAHCIQFYTDLERNAAARHVSEYINLTTFSGFLFCFGYASYLAYFRKERREVFRRFFRNAGKLLAAYYLSCFAYVIFVEKLPLRTDRILELLLLKRLAGWSEFLFSFVLVMLLQLLFFPLFTEKIKWGLLVMAAVSVISCILPWREAGSIAGSLVGGRGGAYFPVVPYGIYLLAGVWFAKKQILFRKSIFMIALAGTAWYAIDYRWISGMQPSRFPLSFPYLAGAAFFLYLYYLLSAVLERKADAFPVRHLMDIGKNSLFYLLVSNMIIFSLKASSFYKMGLIYSTGLFIVILAAAWYLKQIVRRDDKKQSDMLK